MDAFNNAVHYDSTSRLNERKRQYTNMEYNAEMYGQNPNVNSFVFDGN